MSRSRTESSAQALQAVGPEVDTQTASFFREEMRFAASELGRPRGSDPGRSGHGERRSCQA